MTSKASAFQYKLFSKHSCCQAQPKFSSSCTDSRQAYTAGENKLILIPCRHEKSSKPFAIAFWGIANFHKLKGYNFLNFDVVCHLK